MTTWIRCLLQEFGSYRTWGLRRTLPGGFRLSFWPEFHKVSAPDALVMRGRSGFDRVLFAMR